MADTFTLQYGRYHPEGGVIRRLNANVQIIIMTIFPLSIKFILLPASQLVVDCV